MKTALLLAASLLAGAAVAPTVEDKPLATVSSVDLAKYMGRWFEIASFPTIR
jgi:lipocalin